jgi:hypothetical protein
MQLKGNSAEAIIVLKYYCWAYGKKPCDCHQKIDGALPREFIILWRCEIVRIHVAIADSLVPTL